MVIGMIIAATGAIAALALTAASTAGIGAIAAAALIGVSRIARRPPRGPFAGLLSAVFQMLSPSKGGRLPRLVMRQRNKELVGFTW